MIVLAKEDKKTNVGCIVIVEEYGFREVRKNAKAVNQQAALFVEGGRIPAVLCLGRVRIRRTRRIDC